MTRYGFAGVVAVVVAVCALCAMSLASAASAAVTFLLAEWLVSASPITETLLVETVGKLILMNNKAPIINKLASVECVGGFDGFIGPNGADEITEVLNSAKETISATPLVGLGISCTKVSECESGTLYPVHLPWLTLLELWVEGTEEGFVDLLSSSGAGNPGWYVECTILGIKSSEECTAVEGGSNETNVAEGVSGVFSEAFTGLMEQKLALCTGNNEETGVVEGTGGITKTASGPLTISSE